MRPMWRADRGGDDPVRGVGGVARADRALRPGGIDPLTAFQVYGGD
ncbi:MAG: hypothetical protein IPK27_04615 [Rhodanobacteraceae bacterium]|nr:hypothetical protein [Rhodanobacteraceae bacterium]